MAKTTRLLGTTTTTTPLRYTTLHFTTVQHHYHYTTTTLHTATTTTKTEAKTKTTTPLHLHSTPLHYTRPHLLHLLQLLQLLQLQYYNYTSIKYSYSYTTIQPQLQLQLHCGTLHHYIQQLRLGWPLQPLQTSGWGSLEVRHLFFIFCVELCSLHAMFDIFSNMPQLRFQMSYYLGGAPWDTLLSHFLASVLASVLWRVVPCLCREKFSYILIFKECLVGRIIPVPQPAILA